MPLRFVVDPELPDHVRTVSLSYTFYQAEGGAVGEQNRQAGTFEELPAIPATARGTKL
jgi:cytochrome c oxidase assembly protein Cox11